MRPEITIGAQFPDYELPDHTRVPRRLSELQGDAPMLLVLTRGHFCPKDHFQHRLLVEFAPELSVGYSRIVTITTDSLVVANDMRDSLGAPWLFLVDAARSVQKDLDIAEYTDPDHDPMIPHTFVLEPGLVIFRIYNGYWYWGRPSIGELRADLRELTRKIRPDWDLGDPELRAAWAREERHRFFPYEG